MLLRAIFFDLDDTLCDTIGTRSERARKAFERVVAEHPGLDIAWLVRRALEPLAEPREVRGIAAVLNEIGLSETPLGRTAIETYVAYHQPLQLFPGVRETVGKLTTRYNLGIISNGEEWYQQAKIARLQLDSDFSFALFSGAVGYEKPGLHIFQLALSRARAQPEEVVFVGDRLDVDIAGAQAAGMRTVWLTIGVARETPRLRNRTGSLSDLLISSQPSNRSRRLGNGVYRSGGNAIPRLPHEAAEVTAASLGHAIESAGIGSGCSP